MRVRNVLSLFLILATGCGASGTAGTTPRSFGGRVEHARARAASRPDDAAATRQLAMLEMLAVDGDPARAGAAVERASVVAPADPFVAFLKAQWLGRHGQLNASEEAGLAALELARTSNDRFAPFVAEITANDLQIDTGHPDLAPRRRARARAVFAAPGNLGPIATGHLGLALIDDALRRGDADEARATARAMGCVDRYRVAGPFGPRQQLGFDHEFAASGVGPIAESYDLGPTRGVRPTRDTPADGCAIWLGHGEIQAPGTSYAETFVEVPAATDAYLVLTTPNSVALRLDGAEVARLDRREATTPRITVHRVHLAAGRHEIEVKITSRSPSPLLSLRVVGADGLALAGRAATLPEPAALPSADDLDGVYLRALVLSERGDPVAARDVLERAIEGGHAAPEVLALHASLLFGDPIRPADRATDEARAELRQIEARDPDIFLPPLQLAALAANEGRADEAIDTLRAAVTRFPEVISLTLTLVQMLGDQGFEAEAERRLAALAESHPSDCDVLSARRELAESMGRSLAVSALAEAQVSCDARAGARLDTLVAARDWEGASRELARLESLTLDGDVSAFLPARLRLARARGDAAAEAETLARIRARYPRADGPVLAEVDQRVAEGHREEALAVLDRSVERDPTAFARLRTMRGHLGLAHAMQPYRVDGLAAIEAYRASGVTYDSPAVYVLDYAAARVFPDGSYFYLVHQVVQVNSEEALDEVGSFSPPNGELLRLRTIKRDGRILEPDQISGLSELALPRLEVGDFVEYEYVLSEQPTEALEAGVLSHRFYFRSFEGPLHRTEYLVIAPDSVDVRFDRRGPLPDPVVTHDGDLTLTRFRMDRMTKPEPEPYSVNAREFMPSVSWGIGARWAAFRDTLADQLVDTMQRDPELVRSVETILADAHARTPREKAVALFHWVLRNVEGDGTGLFDSAPGMLYDRTGNRDRVLQYMLRLAGIGADLVLVRSTAADQTPSELPEDDTFDGVALRITLPEGPVFVTAEQKGVPFGFLPSSWLGQPGMVVREAGEMLTLPARGTVEDGRDIAIDAELDTEGNAVLHVVETFTGGAAGGWRTDLEQVPVAELEMRFESAYVAPRFPGGRLVSLEVVGMDDAERPLVLRYEVEAPLAFPDGSEAVIAVPLPFELGGALASIADRRTDAMVPRLASNFELRVRLPSGATASNLPAPADVDGPNGSRFHASATLDGRKLVIRRTMDVHRTRVAAADYPALARFARACDREEARPIRVRMP